ncbi:MAG: vWA domain-containing protein [Archangium sp.]
MTLGAPLGLLALLAVPALIAAYFLRRRQPPRTVSALFLWRTPDQRAEAGPRLNRFSRERSLLLELLAVLFATLFLADVRCGQSAPRQHVVVVIDGSVSMNAVVDGASAAERAKTEVARIANRENAGVLTLIETGVKPSLIAGPQQDVDRALATLEKWRPSQPSHDFAPALTLARELSGSSDNRVFFVTDGPIPESLSLLPTIDGRSVGKSAPNLAFLSAQRRDEGGFAQVTVRVGNFDDEERRVTVVFTPTDDAVQKKELVLGAGGSAVLRVGFKTTAPITVRLPEDALTDDGELTLLPAPLAEVSVSVLSDLEAGARSSFTRFFSIAPGVKVTTPALLTIGGPDSTAMLRVGAKGDLRSFIGPFFAQKNHPLLDDVQLGGVVWTAGENPAGHVLMSAGDVVLMSEEDDGTVHLNLDLARSNVQRTVAWPVLLSNVVRQARLSSPGFPRKQLMLGEDTPLVANSGAKWELRGPDGVTKPVMGSGVLTLPPLPAAGEWKLEKDGELFDALVVMPLDPRESDLQTRGAWEVAAQRPQAFASFATTNPRPWWPLVVVLLLVVLDFWLTAAPRTKEVRA